MYLRAPDLAHVAFPADGGDHKRPAEFVRKHLRSTRTVLDWNPYPARGEVARLPQQRFAKGANARFIFGSSFGGIEAPAGRRLGPGDGNH